MHQDHFSPLDLFNERRCYIKFNRETSVRIARGRDANDVIIVSKYAKTVMKTKVVTSGVWKKLYSFVLSSNCYSGNHELWQTSTLFCCKPFLGSACFSVTVRRMVGYKPGCFRMLSYFCRILLYSVVCAVLMLLSLQFFYSFIFIFLNIELYQNASFIKKYKCATVLCIRYKNSCFLSKYLGYWG